jgi:hypothetical protein
MEASGCVQSIRDDGVRMKWSTTVTVSAIALVTVLVVAGGCQATRAGYETAPYRVIRSDGPFELREYPTMQWVETSLGEGQGDSDGSFGLLFRFITGGNASRKKIAMTTPVYMTEAPTPESPSRRVMAFVMPQSMAPIAVPEPSDASVRRRQVAAGRFAVHRFRGGRSAERESAARAELQAWVKDRGLSVADPTPIFGYFDPPWTPAIFRRNEVMLRVEATEVP